MIVYSSEKSLYRPRPDGTIERYVVQNCACCFKEFERAEMEWVSLIDMECARCRAIPSYERRWFDPLSANKSYTAESEAWAHGILKQGAFMFPCWTTSYKHEELQRDFANRLGPAPKKGEMEREGVAAFVARVQRSRWWKSKVGFAVHLDTGFRVKANSWSWGSGSKREIKLAPGHYNRWVVLHEIAHVIAYVKDDHNGHGREWRRWYVLLVERFIGRTEADLLRNAFRRRKLKFTARRQLSPEAKRAAAARLAAMRSAS